MELLYHKTSFKIAPLFILDGNSDYITKHISATHQDLTCDFVTFSKFESCILDPGGMYCFKFPLIKFDVGTYKFEVQVSKIEENISCMDAGSEMIPGYICFPNFRWFVVMPKDVFKIVREKLKELEMSDSALCAELEEREIKDGLYKVGKILNPKHLQ